MRADTSDTNAPSGTAAAVEAMARPYTIGELAAELGLTTRAIRFYETRGLIRPRRKGNARVYDRRDRARLLLILRGKNLGFSLEDIREYLDLYDADPTQERQTLLLIDKVATAIADLEAKKRDIERALADLHGIYDNAKRFLAQR
jgi:DNA-binding transcriptional MerR regulator